MHDCVSYDLSVVYHLTTPEKNVRCYASFGLPVVIAFDRSIRLYGHVLPSADP